MYKVAVCDDENVFLEYIASYCKAYSHELDVDCYNDVFELNENVNNYDCIIVDYEMPGMTAFELFDSIKDSYDGEKILITSHDEMAFYGYQHNIFSFIRKKYFADTFFYTIERLLRHLHVKNTRLYLNDSITHISPLLQDVRYIIAQRNYILVYCKEDKPYRIRYTFSKAVDSIQSNNFVIINRGILLNIHFIKYYNKSLKSVTLLNGQCMWISSSCQQTFDIVYPKYCQQK